MSGFANQIIGGLSKLIRPAIQSPNYAPSSAGWTINQDGSAEFNDATFRGTVVISSGGTALLVYNGAPAAGNMILAISALAGTDNFGNHYNAGITISADSVNPALSWLDNAGTWGSDFPFIRASLANGLIIQGPSTPGSPPATINIDSNTTTELLMYHNGVSVQSIESHQDGLSIHAGGYTNFYAKDDGSGFCFGTDNANNGRVGKYYYEEVTLKSPAQTLVSGTVTQLDNLQEGSIASDYGSAWNLATGVWTCPVTGPYDWNVVIGFLGAMANARCFARVCSVFNTAPFYVVDDVPISAGNLLSASGIFEATAGTQYHVEVFQSAGANRQLDTSTSYIHIGRRL